MKPWFINSREIPGPLKCSICTETFYLPKRLQCGHTFCKDCIDQTLKNDYEKRCPFDRTKVVPYQNQLYFEDKFVQDILDDFNVYCTYLEKGCTWQGLLKELKKHSENCSFKNIEISNTQNLEDLYSDFLNDANNKARLNENLFDKTVFSKKEESKFSNNKDILDAIVEGEDGLSQIDKLVKEEQEQERLRKIQEEKIKEEKKQQQKSKKEKRQQIWDNQFQSDLNFFAGFNQQEPFSVYNFFAAQQGQGFQHSFFGGNSMFNIQGEFRNSQNQEQNLFIRIINERFNNESQDDRLNLAQNRQRILQEQREQQQQLELQQQILIQQLQEQEQNRARNSNNKKATKNKK